MCHQMCGPRSRIEADLSMGLICVDWDDGGVRGKGRSHPRGSRGFVSPMVCQDDSNRDSDDANNSNGNGIGNGSGGSKGGEGV